MGNQKGYEDTLQEMLQEMKQAPPQEQAPPIELYQTVLPKIFDALPNDIQSPNKPLPQIKEAIEQGQPLPKWTGIQKPITTIEERLKKLEERGIEIDIDRKIAEEILRDKGYHMLKEYAEAFVESWPKGKPKYKQGTKFSHVHELYYVNHEISGVLFEILGYIETNLCNNMDYVCSHAAGHHLWWLDTRIVNHEAGEAISAWSVWGWRTPKSVDLFDLQTETLRTAFRYVSNRCKRSHHNPRRILPYGHELLRAQSLGERNDLFLRLKKNEDYREIANQYILNEKVRCYSMLCVLRNLRNAVAHYECLFTRGHYADREIKGHHLFMADKEREQVSLADAILVVQYFLYHISKGRRSEYMRTRLRAIFSKYTESCPALRPILQQYYAYDVYMAETKERLKEVAQEYGCDPTWIARLMGLDKEPQSLQPLSSSAPADPPMPSRQSSERNASRVGNYDRLHRACRAIGAFAYRLVRR